MSRSKVISIAAGEDYTLPVWAFQSPNSGYINHSKRLLGTPDGNTHIGVNGYHVGVDWATLEPEPGVYDFSRLDSLLDHAQQHGYLLQLRIRNAVFQYTPSWFLSYFNVSQSELVDMGFVHNLIVAPVWYRRIYEHFNKLILLMGVLGYPNHPNFGSLYITAVSPSLGEELWFDYHSLARLETYAGMTPLVLEEWLRARINACAAAFEGAIHKLAYVGNIRSLAQNGPDYGAASENLFNLAMSLGIGYRYGDIEWYHRKARDLGCGVSVNDEGYLLVDETAAVHQDNRYYGDEDEEYNTGRPFGGHEYNPLWIERFGPPEAEPHRFRFARLRALQMRFRWLWTHIGAEGNADGEGAINAPLSEYVRLSMGKTANDSPDAWCFLNEAPASRYWSPVDKLKNFERWLIQRDSGDNCQTVPCCAVFRHFNSGCVGSSQEHLWFDYTARRTDVESGNWYMNFTLDKNFVAGATERDQVYIKVEYVDINYCDWWIEYTNHAGDLCRTDKISQSANTGQVYTATFVIEDIKFGGVVGQYLFDGADFRIVCGGPHDVTVRWVRLIRGVGSVLLEDPYTRLDFLRDMFVRPLVWLYYRILGLFRRR